MGGMGGQQQRHMGGMHPSMHPGMHPSMRLGPSHPGGPRLSESSAGDEPGPVDSSAALNTALSSANAVLNQADPPSSIPSSAAPTAGGGEDTEALAAMGGGLCNAFSSGSNNYSSATASLSAGRANYSSYDGHYNGQYDRQYDRQLQQGQFQRGSSVAHVAPVGSSMAFALAAAAASMVANDGHSSGAYAQAALMAAGGTASTARQAACWQAGPSPQPPPLPPHDQPQ